MKRTLKIHILKYKERSGLPRLVVWGFLTIFVIALMGGRAGAATETGIIINTPAEGAVVGQNLELNGIAPQNTLITVNITDADTSRPFVEHQKFGGIRGSTTSDDEGKWVFVPQQEIVPGKFEMQASYVSLSLGQTVSSEKVLFTVVDQGGSSGRFSEPTKRRFFVAIALLILLVTWLVIHILRRRHRNDAKPHVAANDNDMMQQNLETARREALRATSEITELNYRLAVKEEEELRRATQANLQNNPASSLSPSQSTPALPDAPAGSTGQIPPKRPVFYPTPRNSRDAPTGEHPLPDQDQRRSIK